MQGFKSKCSKTNDLSECLRGNGKIKVSLSKGISLYLCKTCQTIRCERCIKADILLRKSPPYVNLTDFSMCCRIRLMSAIESSDDRYKDKSYNIIDYGQSL